MNYIIVNYHYIRPRRNGFKACPEDFFLKQLDYFAENYSLVSIPEAWRAAKEKRKGRYCALSFDDGLKEHYDFVFPVLKKRKIPGSFFLIGQVLREGTIPLTHKLHFLLSRLSVRQIADSMYKFFDGKYKLGDKVRLNPKRRFDDVLTSNLKEVLISLPLKERTGFINHLFGEEPKEKKLAAKLFMNAKEVQRMARAGMDMEPHGYHHLSLETLSTALQKSEIEKSIAIVQQITGRKPKMFSPPHGRTKSETLEIFRRQGIKYATTIHAADLSTAKDSLLLPQFDTNHIKL